MARIEAPGLPEPFAALNRIPIHECGEPLVDMRDACPFVVIRPTVVPYLRRTVANMLNRAQANLPYGYRFHVSTALRTIEMQSGMYWHNYNRLKTEKPHLPTSALRRITNKFFAAPDAVAPPGHTTGGAVDVGILGPDFRGLDMVAPTKNWEAAYTWSEKISEETRRNRHLIIDTLGEAGFSNCRDEWWHWSYGDSAWAVRMGCSVAVYGLIAPPNGYTRVMWPSRMLYPATGVYKTQWRRHRNAAPAS